MRTIALTVPQGVGDIFWVYQKVEPFFDAIDFNILVVADTVVQHRAKKFIELLPKVRNINFKQVSSQDYDKVAASKVSIADLLAGKSDNVYAVNRFLEEGVRLEDIDKEQPIKWDVQFKIPAAPLRTGKYVLFYTSGNKHDTTWDGERWYQLLGSLIEKEKLHNHEFVMFGAEYDRAALRPVAEALSSRKRVKVSWAIDEPADRAIRTIRNADLFVGYQSGLNIIADNYNVRQIMLYFPWLDIMRYGWCKKENIRTKFFAYTFKHSIDEILADIKFSS